MSPSSQKRPRPEPETNQQSQLDDNTPPTKIAKTADIRSFFTRTPVKALSTADADRAEKCYRDNVKNIDLIFESLLRKQKPTTPRSKVIVADHFARELLPFCDAAKALSDLSPRHAFLLVLYISDHAFGDIECGPNSPGFGGTKLPFIAMDQHLRDIIGQRMKCDPPIVDAEDDPGYEDLELDDLRRGDTWQYVGWPENQKLRAPLRNLYMHRRRTAEMKSNQRARERREASKDWVGNALDDLEDTREYLDRWGIGHHFFTRSIERLRRIDGVPADEISLGVDPCPCRFCK